MIIHIIDRRVLLKVFGRLKDNDKLQDSYRKKASKILKELEGLDFKSFDDYKEVNIEQMEDHDQVLTMALFALHDEISENLFPNDFEIKDLISELPYTEDFPKLLNELYRESVWFIKEKLNDLSQDRFSNKFKGNLEITREGQMLILRILLDRSHREHKMLSIINNTKVHGIKDLYLHRLNEMIHETSFELECISNVGFHGNKGSIPLEDITSSYDRSIIEEVLYEKLKMTYFLTQNISTEESLLFSKIINLCDTLYFSITSEDMVKA